MECVWKGHFLLVDSVASSNQFNQIKQKQPHMYLEALSLSSFPLETNGCIFDSLKLPTKHEKPKLTIKGWWRSAGVHTDLHTVPAG